MAWRAVGKNNTDLIEQLVKNGIIKTKRVADAMKAVDRGDYCRHDPYRDRPQSIGYSVTISAPHMHAHALETLESKLQPGYSALDVGSGSGYLCAAMAKMVGSKGKVVGIDHIKELVDLSVANVSKSDKPLLETGVVTLVCGDGRKGFAELAPYDCIHVGAAAACDVPPVLCEQLKPGGVLVVPVDLSRKGASAATSALSTLIGGGQTFRMYTKSDEGTVTYKDLFGVRYVPLCDEREQRSGRF